MRFPVLARPVLRGVVGLVESMIQGIDALGYSAQVSGTEEDPSQRPTSLAIAMSMVFAFFLAMGLFVALPHGLTLLFTDDFKSPMFHLVDGILKMLILLGYVIAIGMMNDIKRVFQYHGAEHKSIYAFEAGEELTVENARKYTTLHPRCGTSFLLFLVLISVVVFSVVFPILGLTQFTDIKILNHLILILVKIVLMFPVAGLSYEFIKFCACRMDSPFFRALAWPGMILQKLTTREPDDEQLEIALASLRQVLRSEKDPGLVKGETEIEIGVLADIPLVPATVGEFAEA